MKGRSRYGHFVLVLVVMAVWGVAIGQPHEFASAVTPPPVWFATYESGTSQTYFNGVVNGRTGQTCSVSLKVANSPAAPTPLGIYSAFYYAKSGPSTNTIPCQWAEHEVLSSGLSNYVQQLNVMVPSHFPNGSLMTLTDWQSFATGHLCSSRACASGAPDLMYSVDANPDRTPHLWVQGKGTHQSLRIPYPLDQWFTVTIAVSIDTTGAPDSHIAASLNGVQFASWVGAISANLTLWGFHNGLYVGAKQGSFSVYNDEDYLWATTSTSPSAPSTTTSTVTTSSTQTSSTMVTATTNSSTTSTSTTTAARTSTVTSSNSSTASSTSSAVATVIYVVAIFVLGFLAVWKWLGSEMP